METENYFDDDKNVIQLTPKDFHPLATWKLVNHRCSIVLFYAPWCSHCKAMKNVWSDLAKKSKNFSVCAFNCEKNKEHILQIKEDIPEMVTGYPTMIVYNEGEPVEDVAGRGDQRNVEYLLNKTMEVCKLN